ncbi:MAG: phosphotransferase enzyme family protein [Nocardioides sp.]
MLAPEDLTALLRTSYGWAEVAVTTHDTGMNSRTWWVDHDAGRAVAKWVPTDDVTSLRAGVAAADLAAASGVATGRHLGDIVEYDGGTVVVLELVPGTELTGDEPGDAEAIGATLARVHRATAGRTVEGALDVLAWVDPSVPELGMDEDVRAAVATAVRRLAAVADRLTVGVGHGDPSPEAFLRDGQQIGLIDWASCVNGPLLFDLASAAMYLDGLEEAAPMLAAYARAGGPVPADEVTAHAGAMLDFRWAVQAQYFAGRLATADLTGLDSDAGNLKGFADARSSLLG